MHDDCVSHAKYRHASMRSHIRQQQQSPRDGRGRMISMLFSRSRSFAYTVWLSIAFTHCVYPDRMQVAAHITPHNVVDIRTAVFVSPKDQGVQVDYEDELRCTIEERVLDVLVVSMRQHHERIERGEQRARPFVTLTYAQSIDGSIAAANKSQVILSGTESRAMTHGLRSIHDAILVGAGTVRQDDPRLNVRHWPPEKGVMSKPTAMDHVGKRGNRLVRHKEGKDITSPRVVILADSLNQLPRAMRLGGAVIFTNVSSPDARGWLAEWASRSREGSKDRAANSFVIVHCNLTTDGRCDLDDCLGKLYAMGFKSLMVEGGATIISSFLRALDEKDSKSTVVKRMQNVGRLVDRIVVTIVPRFLQGYNVLSPPSSGTARTSESLGFPLQLADVSYVPLGRDVVLIGSPVPNSNP